MLPSWRSLTKIAGSRSTSGSISQSYGSADPDLDLYQHYSTFFFKFSKNFIRMVEASTGTSHLTEETPRLGHLYTSQVLVIWRRGSLSLTGHPRDSIARNRWMTCAAGWQRVAATSESECRLFHGTSFRGFLMANRRTAIDWESSKKRRTWLCLTMVSSGICTMRLVFMDRRRGVVFNLVRNIMHSFIVLDVFSQKTHRGKKKPELAGLLSGLNGQKCPLFLRNACYHARIFKTRSLTRWPSKKAPQTLF